MNGGLEFTLLGIPVRVMWMFFIIMFVFGSSWQEPILIVLWVAIAFVSILAHEFGHALVYRAFGVEPSVVLHGFGGLTFGRSLPIAKDLVVSLAGPLVGLSIGLPLLYINNTMHVADPTVRDALAMGIYINVFWSVINLLPLMPLDGGNALNAFLALVTRRDMTRVTRVISIITAAVLIGVALKYQVLFGAILGGYFLYMNVQALIQGGSGRFAPNMPMAPQQGAVAPSPYPGPPPSAYPPAPPSGGAQPPYDHAPGAPPSGPPGASEAPRAPQDWSAVPPAQPPTAGVPPSPDPAIVAAWTQPQVGPRRRTFGQEVESTAQALARNEPELASIAVDRAARLAQTPEDSIVVQQLRDEVMRRLSANGH